MFNLDYNIYKNIEDIFCDIKFLKKKDTFYSNISSCFDIETTSFYENENKRANMYAFVFGLNGKCIIGRTWSDFENIINKLVIKYKLNINKRLIIYVHNLAYEFQFIKDRFKWYKVFCNKPRTPIYAITIDGIEFRCSYLLSGYSLQKVGEKLNKYKVNKKVGDLDYNLIRNSKTPLNDKELGYILNDGLVVMAYIQELLETENILQLPITKTGFVRKLVRKKCFEYGYYKSFIKCLKLDLNSYEMLKSVYMGGFTHANCRKSNKLYNNVASYDFSSSYPAVMLSEKFPMSSPKKVDLTKLTKEEFYKLLDDFCCMFTIKFNNIDEKVKFEHYIPISKCIDSKEVAVDNGRIISAREIIINLTEQDFKIIEQLYKWESGKVLEMYIFTKSYLPKPIIETILDLYEKKTMLKNVEGKEVEYMNSKENINGIYGMCVTDICKNLISYSNINGWYIDNSKSKEDIIKEYNVNKNRFLYYAWGVWVSAYARSNLFNGILEFKKDYIYSDTDSLKVLNYLNHKEYIENYNKKINKKLCDCLNFYKLDTNKLKPKTIKGIEKPLGVWDFEGVYDNFKTIGAKRYIYSKNNEIQITIAGVNKKSGKDYLLYKFKDIKTIFNRFNDGLIFPATYINDKNEEVLGCGKLTHTYIDEHYTYELVDYLGNKDNVEEYSYVHLEPCEYRMDLETKYKLILQKIMEEENIL